METELTSKLQYSTRSTALQLITFFMMSCLDPAVMYVVICGSVCFLTPVFVFSFNQCVQHVRQAILSFFCQCTFNLRLFRAIYNHRWSLSVRTLVVTESLEPVAFVAVLSTCFESFSSFTIRMKAKQSKTLRFYLGVQNRAFKSMPSSSRSDFVY